MPLEQEFHFPNPIRSKPHEALMNIVVTGTLLSKQADIVLKPRGLTASQFNVLMLLKYQSSDGKINQSGLSEMLLVNRSNITGLVDRLERAGWVKRIPDRIDRRVKYIQITDEGVRVLDEAEQVYFQGVESVMSSLSNAECNALCRALEEIRKQLRQ